jgi:hypothetical protein
MKYIAILHRTYKREYAETGASAGTTKTNLSACPVRRNKGYNKPNYGKIFKIFNVVLPTVSA